MTAALARPVDPAGDAALLHDWLTRPASHFWGMTQASVEQVREAYLAIEADPHQRAVLGELDGRPAYLAEFYDPAHGELGTVYDVRSGDLGMHFLAAPADGAHVPGFTRRVISDVMRLAFADPSVERVVVEPDVRNEAVHVLNAAVGFVSDGIVQLADKRALLSFCRRADFRPWSAS